jgi:hypothetical protein
MGEMTHRDGSSFVSNHNKKKKAAQQLQKRA